MPKGPKEKKTDHPHIVMTEGFVGGRPRIKGSRISVELVAALFRAGDTPDDIRDMYSHVSLAAIYDAIAYYLDHPEETDALLAERDEAARDLDGYLRKQGFEKLPGGGYRPVPSSA